MAAQKRRRAMMAVERERRAWVLYTEHGATHHAIAAELHVSRRAVGKMIERVRALALDDLRGQAVQEKAVDVAQVESVYRQAIQAWHASKGERIIRTSTHRDGEVTTKVQVEQSAGDTRHLMAALAAKAQKAQLLGYNAPTRTVNTNMHVDLFAAPPIVSDKPALSENELRESMRAYWKEYGFTDVAIDRMVSRNLAAVKELPPPEDQ